MKRVGNPPRPPPPTSTRKWLASLNGLTVC